MFRSFFDNSIFFGIILTQRPETEKPKIPVPQAALIAE